MKAKHGRVLQPVKCDIAALHLVIEQAKDLNGPIVVVVSKVTNETHHSIDDTAPDTWNERMDVNLLPHLFTVQAATKG